MKLTGIAICLLISLVGFAQQPRVLSYTEESGFAGASTFITDAQIDSDGYLWIVSINNLSRYDGERFFNYDLNKVAFSVLLRFQESNNQKYVVDQLGKVFFIQEDSLIEYKNNRLLDSVHQAGFYTDNYFDNQGNYHFSTHEQAYLIIQNDKVKDVGNFAKQNKWGGSCVLRDDQPPFWFYSGNKTIPLLNRFFYLYDKELNPLDSVLVASSKSMTPQFAIKTGEDYVFSDGVKTLIKFNDDSIISTLEYDYPILRIVNDNEGNLWVSTSGGGVHFYESAQLKLENRKVFFDGTANILSTFDSEGGAWMFSGDKGLQYIPNINSIFFEPRDFENSRPFVMSSFKDSLYVASQNSISVINLLNNKIINQSSLLDKNEHILEMNYDEQFSTEWLTTRGFVYYKKKKTWNRLKLDYEQYPFLRKQILYLYSTKGCNCDYTMIVTSRNSMIFLSDTNVQKVLINPSIVGRITQIQYVEETIFLRTNESLYKIVDDSIYDLSKSLKIENDNVERIIFFDNHLLLSLNAKGTFYIKNNQLEPLRVDGKHIPLAEFLIVNDSLLWVLSNESSFKINSLNDTMNSAIEFYEPLENIFKSDVIATKSSIVQLRGYSGIEIIPFEQIQSRKATSPRLKITQLKINDQDTPFSDETINLTYNENLIKLSYKSISFKNWLINYQYRLQGLDNKWRKTREEQVQFTNLKPGEYTFEVKAKKGSQEWSKSQMINFTIAAPFWEKWWFILLVVLFISASIYFVAQKRIKIIQKENELIIAKLNSDQKALRAKMSPHFIFNIITSAQYLIMKGPGEKAIQFLHNFADLLRSVLDQTEQESITLESCMSTLRSYLELERFRLGENFDYTLEVDNGIEIKKERTIPFMIQPFLENAIHHGIKDYELKGYLSIHFSIENDFLKVIIEDNGIGREASKKLKTNEKLKQQSHGINIIKQRLRIHNEEKLTQDVIIEDKYENGAAKGTKVSLFIKRLK